MTYGNDPITLGKKYVISEIGAGSLEEALVFTKVGTDIYLKKYNPTDQGQIWLATHDDKRRYGLVNVGANVRAGRNRYENLKCESNIGDLGDWECFRFEKLTSGRDGYWMQMLLWDKWQPLKKTSDSGGYYMTIAETSDFAVGLTIVE